MNRLFSLARQFWPSPFQRASHGEKWISAVGGFFAILCVLWISHGVLDQQGTAMLVASMGATTVLLFAVPHGALSQPWPVIGGNLVSATIGITCAQQIADPYLAAAIAVGLAILAMYYLRCLHPPGGATALISVLGGESVQQLGYQFLLTPVLLNVLVILAIAVLFNLPFQWRRYPVDLVRAETDSPLDPAEETMITHSDLVYALSQLDSFIDVSEQDLIRIYTLAVHHRHSPVPCHLYGEECEHDNEHCLCRQLMAHVEPEFVITDGGKR